MFTVTLMLLIILLFIDLSYSYNINLVSRRLCNPTKIHRLPQQHLQMMDNKIDTSLIDLRNKNSKVNHIPKVLKQILITLSAFLISFKTFSKKVYASSSAIKGWDLFGRVPNDDWLFSNWRLTDPNILKQTFTEALTTELPVAMHAYRRRKRIQEIFSTLGSVGTIFASVLTVGFLYKRANKINRRRASSNGGYNFSAISKKGGKNEGRDLGQSGWKDMDYDED